MRWSRQFWIICKKGGFLFFAEPTLGRRIFNWAAWGFEFPLVFKHITCWSRHRWTWHWCCRVRVVSVCALDDMEKWKGLSISTCNVNKLWQGNHYNVEFCKNLKNNHVVTPSCWSNFPGSDYWLTTLQAQVFSVLSYICSKKGEDDICAILVFARAGLESGHEAAAPFEWMDWGKGRSLRVWKQKGLSHSVTYSRPGCFVQIYDRASHASTFPGLGHLIGSWVGLWNERLRLLTCRLSRTWSITSSLTRFITLTLIQLVRLLRLPIGLSSNDRLLS